MAFYTKFVEFLNTKQGQKQLFAGLGIEYSSLVQNPEFVEPERKFPWAAEGAADDDPKSLKYLPPPDENQVPNVKFSQVIVRADYNPRDSRAQKLPVFDVFQKFVD